MKQVHCCGLIIVARDERSWRRPACAVSSRGSRSAAYAFLQHPFCALGSGMSAPPSPALHPHPTTPRARPCPHTRVTANFANIRSEARAQRSCVRERPHGRHAGGMVERLLESRPAGRRSRARLTSRRECQQCASIAGANHPWRPSKGHEIEEIEGAPFRPPVCASPREPIASLAFCALIRHRPPPMGCRLRLWPS